MTAIKHVTGDQKCCPPTSQKLPSRGVNRWLAEWKGYFQKLGLKWFLFNFVLICKTKATLAKMVFHIINVFPPLFLPHDPPK